LIDYEQDLFGIQEETKHREPEPEQIDYAESKQAGLTTRQMFE